MFRLFNYYLLHSNVKMGELDCVLIPSSATEPHKQVEKIKPKKMYRLETYSWNKNMSKTNKKHRGVHKKKQKGGKTLEKYERRTSDYTVGLFFSCHFGVTMCPILIVPTCVSMFSQPFVYVYVGSSVYCQIVCSPLPVYFKSEYEKKNKGSTSVYSLFTFTLHILYFSIGSTYEFSRTTCRSHYLYIQLIMQKTNKQEVLRWALLYCWWKINQTLGVLTLLSLC